MTDDYIYSKEDIFKAFDMGLETVLVVLEKSIKLMVRGWLLKGD